MTTVKAWDSGFVVAGENASLITSLSKDSADHFTVRNTADRLVIREHQFSEEPSKSKSG